MVYFEKCSTLLPLPKCKMVYITTKRPFNTESETGIWNTDLVFYIRMLHTHSTKSDSKIGNAKSHLVFYILIFHKHSTKGTLIIVLMIGHFAHCFFFFIYFFCTFTAHNPVHILSCSNTTLKANLVYISEKVNLCHYKHQIKKHNTHEVWHFLHKI